MNPFGICALATVTLAVSAGAQDSASARRMLAVARTRDAEIGRIRSESAAREGEMRRNIDQLNARLHANTAELQQTLAGIGTLQSRDQKLDALADAAPQLIGRIRGNEDRYAADARTVTLRATDRVIVIERGLESLRLKANALHTTAVAFNAGFDLGSLASPTSFSTFESSIQALKSLTTEKQRGPIDMLVGWLKKVPGVPIVSSLAGVVVNAMSNPVDTRKAPDMKAAGERLMCIAVVSQSSLERMESVRRASERLERLSADVERRATAGGNAIQSAVSLRPNESFESFMRRTYGDLASDSTRRPLPYDKIEPALLTVAAAARLEYDLSRSSADLATELVAALQEPTPVTNCPDENHELRTRFDNLRPAVRNLTESLTSLASADDGIAVFVPALPGR